MKACVYTNGGGEGVLSADALELYKIEISETPENLKNKLKKVLPSFSSLHNPIDTTAQASEDQYLEGLRIILEDSFFDIIIAILLPQLPLYTLDFPKKFSKIYKGQKPLIFIVYGGVFAKKIAKELEKYVPVFDSPIQAAKAANFIKELRC